MALSKQNFKNIHLSETCATFILTYFQYCWSRAGQKGSEGRMRSAGQGLHRPDLSNHI
jgi:hypothetical protein